MYLPLPGLGFATVLKGMYERCERLDESGGLIAETLDRGHERLHELGLRDAETFGHLLVEKSFASSIRLHPFAIDDELWDSALAGVAKDFLGGAWRLLNVNFSVGDFVLVEKTLGLAAIGTPERGVDEKFHGRSFNHARTKASAKGNPQMRMGMTM
jgi:hypothetical protein